MKYVDEFSNHKVVKAIVSEINSLKIPGVRIMEVCGTHTMAIFRSGIKQLINKKIELISGPGCPVCVTSQHDIDKMIALARLKNVIITTFGDMLKVPGSRSSLEKERAGGALIEIVYSPLDVLDIAGKHQNKEIIFLAVGFETTAPVVAAMLQDAAHERIKNVSVYCAHKLIPPAMRALIESEEVLLDGFLCPGHVSAIIGSNAYNVIASKYNIPCVISGFEPVDILESIYMLAKQISEGKAEVQNQYQRVVRLKGNKRAQQLMEKVFDIQNAPWRGLGTLRSSGYSLNKKFGRFDAENKFSIKVSAAKEPAGCICDKVLKGIKIL